MTDEHSVPDRPDSDLASGRRARRALPQLRLERGSLVLLASLTLVVFIVLLLWLL
jgi:hypothetical protein